MQKIPGGNELLNPQDVLKRVGVEYNMTVGDLGCGGAGYFTLQAAHIVGENGRVYAVDILKSALASVEGLAKQSGIHNITTVWSNLELYGATKIPDHSLDIALLINTLFQSKLRADVMKESTRMTKMGGKLLVIDWKPAGSPLGPPPKSRVHPDEMRKIAKNLGLAEVNSFEAGPFHFALVFTKKA